MAEPFKACSLSPGEAAGRAEEFRALAQQWLSGRDRSPDQVRLRFRDEPGVHEAVEDLARRERECCRFLALRVERAAGEVTLAIGAAPEDRAALDAFYELAA
jgi:hypothetical protein